VLKQRCRDLGVTRWPYRKVKKLDTIINALEAPGSLFTESTQRAARATRHEDAKTRLETLKNTRELLITQPNSKAHLRIGKLEKELRRRFAARDGNSSDRSSEGKSGNSGNSDASQTQVQSKSSDDASELNSRKRKHVDIDCQQDGVLGDLITAAAKARKDATQNTSYMAKDTLVRKMSSFSSGSTGSGMSEHSFAFLPYGAPLSGYVSANARQLPSHVQKPTPRRFCAATPSSLANNPQWMLTHLAEIIRVSALPLTST
jgi:hypothetical protein